MSTTLCTLLLQQHLYLPQQRICTTRVFFYTKHASYAHYGLFKKSLCNAMILYILYCYLLCFYNTNSFVMNLPCVGRFKMVGAMNEKNPMYSLDFFSVRSRVDFKFKRTISYMYYMQSILNYIKSFINLFLKEIFSL